jgi:hypothetical protein
VSAGGWGQSGQDGRVFPGSVLCDDPAFDVITPMFLLHEERLDKRWLGAGLGMQASQLGASIQA